MLHRAEYFGIICLEFGSLSFPLKDVEVAGDLDEANLPMPNVCPIISVLWSNMELFFFFFLVFKMPLI